MSVDGIHLNGMGASLLGGVIGEAIGVAISRSEGENEDEINKWKGISKFWSDAKSYVDESFEIDPLPVIDKPFSLFSSPASRKFQNYTYGEITVESVCDLCVAAGIGVTSEDIVVDLGCGRGGVLLGVRWWSVNREKGGGERGARGSGGVKELIGMDMMGGYIEEGRRAVEGFAAQQYVISLSLCSQCHTSLVCLFISLPSYHNMAN